ncbi:MAG: hypothetical protein ACOY9Y_10840 [Bacillota bacterium]
MFGYSGNRRVAVGPRVEAEEPVPAPVKTYKLTPEEIAAKYGPPRRTEKPSPLAALADPVMWQLKKRGAKHDSRGRQETMGTTGGNCDQEAQE